MYNIYDKTNITVQMQHEHVLHNKTKQKKDAVILFYGSG